MVCIYTILQGTLVRLFVNCQAPRWNPPSSLSLMILGLVFPFDIVFYLGKKGELPPIC
jgi:hypothetical protein